MVNSFFGLGNSNAPGHLGQHRPVALLGPDLLPGRRQQVRHEGLGRRGFGAFVVTAIGFWMRMVCGGVTT